MSINDNWVGGSVKQCLDATETQNDYEPMVQSNCLASLNREALKIFATGSAGNIEALGLPNIKINNDLQFVKAFPDGGKDGPGDGGEDQRRNDNEKVGLWNGRIGATFFNSGKNKNEWNGNFEGLKDMLAAANKDLSSDQFKKLAECIKEGTGGAFQHKLDKDNMVTEITIATGSEKKLVYKSFIGLSTNELIDQLPAGSPRKDVQSFLDDLAKSDNERERQYVLSAMRNYARQEGLFKPMFTEEQQAIIIAIADRYKDGVPRTGRGGRPTP